MQIIEPKPATPLPPSPRVLVLGSGGQLGRAWTALLAARRIAHEVLDYPTFDLGNPDHVRTSIRPGFTHVINCAAWTDVDGAEGDEPAATRLTGEGVRHLARACRGGGAHLVHYSTDYIFAGDATRPYAPDAEPSPCNAYGRSKLAGELALQESGAAHTLIRTSWLYSPWGKNFVRTIAGLARSRTRLRVVDDQHGRPTSAEHLAAASLALLQARRAGTWHVCDGGSGTWYDLARHVVELIGSPCRVEPCTTADFPRPAARPAYGVLDLTKTEAAIGKAPDWRSSVADVVGRLTLEPAAQEARA